MLIRKAIKEKWNAVPKIGKPYLILVLLGIVLQNSPYSLSTRQFLLYLVILCCYTAIAPMASWESRLSGFERVKQLIIAIIFPTIGIFGLLFLAKIWKFTKW